MYFILFRHIFLYDTLISQHFIHSDYRPITVLLFYFIFIMLSDTLVSKNFIYIFCISYVVLLIYINELFYQL